ncbi:hypothetical protein [Candidatus Liberibacter sp.]|uniref:hypothetical protein n=1 Tax=Candidatus Liberibacter sp. TaxID=34022 RepID=UPI0015F3DD53|nr:hypothetical protein [Candidatus Liberibacter sp.]MBA5723565.1 hypothetical protein [Candidatus Liberibacter sp.]
MIKTAIHILILLLASCTTALSADSTIKSLTVYSSRNKDIMSPIFQSFEEQTGIKINAQYASTPELLNLIKKRRKTVLPTSS